MKEISDARLIYVTTTYVPEHEEGRFSNDVKIYNKAAKEVMKKYSVSINDIFKKSKSIHKKYGIGIDDVHYTAKGNEELSKLINAFLEKEIKKL
jgi:lysophospholipase L1-like esterase